MVCVMVLLWLDGIMISRLMLECGRSLLCLKLLMVNSVVAVLVGNLVLYVVRMVCLTV